MLLEELDDDAFLEGFKTAGFCAEEWDHLGHIRAGALLVNEMTPEDALPIMRAGLLGLLDRARAEGHDPRTGYHETVTLCWLKLIRAALDAQPTPLEDARNFCRAHEELHDPRLHLRHYTKDLLRSDAAFNSFVEPDLQPLP